MEPLRIAITYILSVAITFFSAISGNAQDVRIMPLGNSITYDHNSLDKESPRPVGDRIAYRYKLYQLLNSEGIMFDFVGSEDSGNTYFQDEEMDDNAGFPGINASQMVNLLNTGYNARTEVTITPGPYLMYHPADIILLHIGTNDFTTDPANVEDLLDAIRFYDSEVIILISRIINRKTYHPETTIFNDNVEAMVNARADNKIFMVKMDSGAGINYPAEMIDDLHPNQAGYDKMAVVWFNALMDLNEPPVISNIPVQRTEVGNPFPDLILDSYVSDPEDPDASLVWSFEQSPASVISISIDGNRILHASPQSGWSGTETITLRVHDTGSGTLVRSRSVEVIFKVGQPNTPPVVINPPVGLEFLEQFGSADLDLSGAFSDPDGDYLALTASSSNNEVVFSTVTGTALRLEERGLGTSMVNITADDGEFRVSEIFPVTVSTYYCTGPDEPNNNYQMSVDLGNADSYDNPELCLTPSDQDWFKFLYNGSDYFIMINGYYTYTGGTYGLSVDVTGSDLHIETYPVDGPTNTRLYLFGPDHTTQLAYDDDGGTGSFSLINYSMTAVPGIKGPGTLSNYINELNIYPNPTGGIFSVGTYLKENGPLFLELLDPAGRLLLQKRIVAGEAYINEQVDISHQPAGIYFIQIHNSNFRKISKVVIY